MLSGTIAELLRAQHVDAEAVVERLGLPGTPDEALLELAAQERRVLVTKNLVDFLPLAQQWAVAGRTHHGLVLVSTKTFPESRHSVRMIAAALGEACTAGSLPGPGQQVWLRPVSGGTAR